MSAKAAYANVSGDQRRHEAELVRVHADLVKRIAYHVAARLPPSVDVDDLIQAGVMGLIEAARHYNGERGASFETYASIRIRGAMMDELRRGDWAPRSVHRKHREIAQAMQNIEQRTGRVAREEEVIAALGMEPQVYRMALQDAVQCQVLSINESGDDGDENYDIADHSGSPLESLEREEFQRRTVAAIASLPERERLVLSLYYEQEMNLREIGAVLEVSESRVCQIHGQALLRLRSKLAEGDLTAKSKRVTKSHTKAASTVTRAAA